MRFLTINILRIASLGLVMAGAICEWPWWPLWVAPWVVLNLVGIGFTIPLTALVFGAGAQDACSDEFANFILFVLPTVIAIAASAAFRLYRTRKRRELIHSQQQSGAAGNRSSSPKPTAPLETDN